jgi:hypothetical protein
MLEIDFIDLSFFLQSSVSPCDSRRIQVGVAWICFSEGPVLARSGHGCPATSQAGRAEGQNGSEVLPRWGKTSVPEGNNPSQDPLPIFRLRTGRRVAKEQKEKRPAFGGALYLPRY